MASGGRRRWKIRPFAVSCVKRVAFRFGKYTVICPEWPGGKGSSLRRRAAKPVMRPLPGCGRKWGGTKNRRGPSPGEDQAETLLLHLFRGTHLAGMQGCAPGRCDHPSAAGCQPGRDRGGLCAQGVFWRTDSTNPHRRLCQKPCPAPDPAGSPADQAAATAHLAEACDAIGEVMDYMEAEAERLYRLCRIVQEPDQLYGKCLMKREENDLP